MDWTLAGTVNDVRALAPLNTLSAMVAIYGEADHSAATLESKRANGSHTAGHDRGSELSAAGVGVRSHVSSELNIHGGSAGGVRTAGDDHRYRDDRGRHRRRSRWHCRRSRGFHCGRRGHDTWRRLLRGWCGTHNGGQHRRKRVGRANDSMRQLDVYWQVQMRWADCCWSRRISRGAYALS
jgi:hypothetical protein